MLQNSKYSEVDHISVSGYQEILLRQPPQHRERVNLRCCRESKNAEEQGAGSRGFLLSHVINNHPKISLFSYCLLPVLPTPEIPTLHARPGAKRPSALPPAPEPGKPVPAPEQKSRLIYGPRMWQRVR